MSQRIVLIVQKHNFIISDLNKQNSDSSDTFMNKIEALKREMWWLNVAIENVKETHTDCKNMLVVRDNTIEALVRSLKLTMLTEQRCNKILLESCQREFFETR